MAGEPRPRRSSGRPKRYEHEGDGADAAEGGNGAAKSPRNEEGSKNNDTEEATSPTAGERPRRSPVRPKRYEHGPDDEEAPVAAGGGTTNGAAKSPRKKGGVEKQEPPEKAKSPRIKIRLGKRKAPPSDEEEEEESSDEEGEGAREVKVKVTVGGKAVQKKLCRALLEAGDDAQDVSESEEEEEESEEESEEEEEEREVKVRVSLGGKPLQKRCSKALISPQEESEEEESDEESEEASEEEEEREVKVRVSLGGKPLQKKFCTALISPPEESGYEQIDDIDESSPIKHPGRKCKADGCHKYNAARMEGYCRQHFEEFGEGTSNDSTKVGEGAPIGRQCVAEGCVKFKAARSDGFCKMCFEAKNGGTAEEMEVESREEAESGEGEVEEEEGEATKVRLRIEKKLTKRTYEAILPEGVMERVQGKAKGEKSSSSVKEDEAEDAAQEPAAESDAGEEKKEDDGDLKPAAKKAKTEGDDAKPSATPTKLPADWRDRLDFEITLTSQKKSNGALKCRAVGCQKNSQGSSAGFCRAHHNRYLICTGQCGSWTCKCGDKIADFMARCGRCHRWRGGVHGGIAAKKKPGATMDEDRGATPGVVLQAPTRNYPDRGRTHVPPDAGVQISDVLLTNSKGRSLCKVVGCGKLDQSGNDGFCRMHYNMFSVDPDGEGEDGAPWTCDCGNVLSGRNKRCGVCNRWREGRHPVFKSSASSRSGISLDNIIYTNENGEPLDDWTCDECGNRVSGTKSRCGACHRWRNGKRVGTKVVEVDARPPWECQNCRASNPASKRKCAGCQAYRKKRASDSGSDVVVGGAGWNCGQCDFTNFPKELACFMCQAARPNLAWHQRQQLLSSSSSVGAAETAPYPVQATAAALASAAQLATAAAAEGTLAEPGAEAVDAALDSAAPALGAAAPAQTSDVDADDINYYGTCPEGVSFPYISLYYDFNQAYVRNQAYPYLNAGTQSSGDGDKEKSSSDGERTEEEGQLEGKSSESSCDDGEQQPTEEDQSDR